MTKLRQIYTEINRQRGFGPILCQTDQKGNKKVIVMQADNY
jgi:hypothetical protein